MANNLTQAQRLLLKIKGLGADFRGSIGQMGARQEQHAQELGVLTRGTLEAPPATSLYINPQKSQDTEKFDLQTEMKDRLNASLIFQAEQVNKSWFRSSKLSQWAKDPTFSNKVTSTLDAVNHEIGKVIVVLKDIMVNGWKLQRISQSLAVLAGDIVHKANRVLYREAPVVQDHGFIISQTSHNHHITTDVMTKTVRDDLARISGTLGLEADFMVSLVKTAMLLKSTGDLELYGKNLLRISSSGELILESTDNMKISAKGDLEIISGGDLTVGSSGSASLKGSSLSLLANTSLIAQAGTTATVHGVAAATLASVGVAAVSGATGAIPFPGMPVPPADPSALVPVLPPLPVPEVEEPELIKPSGDVRGVDILPGIVGLDPVLNVWN